MGFDSVILAIDYCKDSCTLYLQMAEKLVGMQQSLVRYLIAR